MEIARWSGVEWLAAVTTRPWAGGECSHPVDPPQHPLTAVAAESNWAVVLSADVERHSLCSVQPVASS